MTGTDLGMVVGFATLASVLIALWRGIKAEIRDLRQEFKTLRENDLKHVDAGIAALGTRIAGMDARITEIGTDMVARFGQVDIRLGDFKGDMDVRFGQVDARMDRLDARIGRVDARAAEAQQRLEGRIESLSEEMRGNHRQVLGALEGLEQAG